LWSNGQTTANISNLSPATYTVTVTDQNACTKQSSATVTSANAPVISLPVITNVSCFAGSNGAISLTVTGGTAPLTYLWSNSATTKNISGLTVGTYTITVTDANSCSTSSTYTVSEPAAISLSNVVTDVSCNGGANGIIDLSVAGGIAPYSYLWSNSKTTQDINLLIAGVYTVTVTDANSCTAQKSITVTQPSVISAIGTVTNVKCNGQTNGSIALSVSGGTASYSFLWNTGSTSQNLGSLGANTFTVTVTDANSCTRSFSFLVTQPANLSVSYTATASTCGNANGSITANPAGGTSPYTYLWSNGQTIAQINNLASANYTLTITDANSCTFVSSKSVTNINGPSLGSLVISNVSCKGGTNGSVLTNVSGGTAPINYLWSNGATTSNLSAIIAGNYTVTVTDANNCTATKSGLVTEPSAIILTPSSVSTT
jgi:hypothetical protein